MKYHRYNVQEPRLLQDAIMHGRTAITIGPEIDGAHKAYALACHQWSEHLGRTGGTAAEVGHHRNLAILHYRRAFALNPQHYGAHNNLGNLFLEWGKNLNGEARREKLHAAKTEFESALRINPAYHHAADNLGNTFYAEGRGSDQPAERKARYAEAAQAFRNALQYEPTYPEATNDLAMLHLEPENDPFSPEEALHLHLHALRLINDSATQRRKLCAQFTSRLALTATSRKTSLVPTAATADEIKELGCQCPLGQIKLAEPGNGG
jgi:tetratricopeptide (TPR) repeat protein